MKPARPSEAWTGHPCEFENGKVGHPPGMSKCQPSPEELSFKRVNYIRDIFAARSQSCMDFEPIATAPSFIEKYLGFIGTLHAHFVFSAKGAMGQINAYDLCAIFKRAPFVIEGNADGALLIDRITEISRPKELGGDQQHSMFVDDVEFRNYPEIAGDGIFAVQVRSIVRLQCLNFCERKSVEQGFNHSASFPEVRTANADGEIGGFSTCHGVPVQNGQLADQMIQGRTEIMNDIPDNQRPSVIIGQHLRMSDIETIPLKLIP
jgi:hypothetical protein